ncbi:MAG TPA: TerC family protein [Thermomicrobiales bacterium]|nr:TerC family protein [Thermomicrobiales bacterium]
MLSETALVWIGFNLFVLVLLAVDLGLVHRTAHAVSPREALRWTGVWVALAVLFGVGVYFWHGTQPALEFFAGYLVEYSLSADNVFVFVLIFTFFAVPAAYQHRVLFWGIIGALVLRGAMIVAGAALLEAFHWLIYLFGAFLIVTGVRMALHREAAVHPEQNLLVRLVRRVLPVTKDYEGEHFFVRRAGRLLATPLFVVLLVITTADLIFALDSIPAIFGVTRDPFIVYTSNVFAILGLRSLYFVLAGAVAKFHYLQVGLAAVLTFVGAKMVVSGVYHLPVAASLAVIVLILGIAIAASLLRERALRRAAGAGRPAPAEGS